MKTAILLSGHMRTFDRCLPTLHWHVFRHFPGADFYVSTVADADAWKAELLREQYPDAKVTVHAVEQPELPIPEPYAGRQWREGTMYGHEPYALSVSPQAVLRQLWQLQQVFDLVANFRSYDIVIRCRPDLWFHSFRIRTPRCWHALTPWWGRFGGVNDRFAVLGQDAAIPYFCTFEAVPALIELGCPLHPESLILGSLRLKGIVNRPTLRAEFSTLRTTGELRSPEISAVDIAHMGSA